MPDHRCSQCGREYSTEEYLNLEKSSRVTDDPNDQYGVESVCECGAKFHSDKWRLVNDVEVGDKTFTVSTVALTIPHGTDRDQWYETMVFGTEWGPQRRYTAQEEAERGHEEVVGKLRSREFHFETVAERLVLD